MRQPIRAALGAALLFGGLAAAAGPAWAAPPNLTCSSPASATAGATYNNVTIPAGDTCTLSGNTIEGTINGGNGSTLNASSTSVAKNTTLATGSTLNTPSGGDTFTGDVNLSNGAAIAVGNGPNTFGGDLTVNGLSGTGNYICNSFVTKDLNVQHLVAGATLNVGDETTNSPITSGQTCSFSVAVAGNVTVSNNAGFFSDMFTGDSSAVPASDASGLCMVTNASSASVAGWVHGNLDNSNNTAGFVLENTNVCHDATANNNKAPSGQVNKVSANNTGNNFTANNNTGTGTPAGTNSITNNHADHDAHCMPDSPVVNGNSAGHTDSCPNNP